jgi:tetratricopeptide (TPR) repeat protein
MSTANLDDLCTRAREAVGAGKYQDGRSFYSEAVTVAPDSADAHYGLATCCFLLGDHETALKHFREVVRLDPQRATAFINLGALHNRSGRLDEAITNLRKGLELDPRRAEGYYNLGIAYRQKGMPDLAIQAYREATRLNPRMADAFFNLGNVLFESERFADAVTVYRQAIAVRPNFEKALLGLRNAEQSLAAMDKSAQPPAPTTSQAAHEETTQTTEVEAPLVFGNAFERAEAMELLLQVCLKQEQYCRDMVQAIENDLGRSLRDLSNSLVGKAAAGELELHVQAYEISLQNLRNARQNLDTGTEHIRDRSRRFVISAQAVGESGV